MIKVLVIKEKQNIITLEASGHSGYAEEGSDIVCSAVSTLMQTLANGLTEVVKTTPEVVVDEDNAHMSICLKSVKEDKMSSAQILMQTTYLSLKDLADSYNQFIKIKEKQV